MLSAAKRPTLLYLLVALLANALACPLASAQNLPEGRRKANVCAACHGLDGVGRFPEVPAIAGQPAAYLERQMHAYRTGERRSEIMAMVMKYLTDDDIRDLAAHYASVETGATPR